jgi:diguanylate cyclase (GGDEF)-like protein
MELLDALSEAVIDTLKKFSSGKRLLTPATLKEAISARKDIISLLHPSLGGSANVESNGASVFAVEPAPVSQDESNTLQRLDLGTLTRFQNLFLKMLNNLGPVIRDNYEKRFNELQEKINGCESILSLALIGDHINQMLGELIDQSVERINFSNDFLVELSKDLYKMEEQLSSYQDYTKESHNITNEFHDNLLVHTEDVNRAVASLRHAQNIHNLITSKINIISRAIEDKRQMDKVRKHEADSQICKLQNDLNTYKQEILQVKERTESLEKEIMLDELTQISNRRAYDLQILENLRHYHRTGELFSLILIDIDHFKRVNDTYGHKIGDNCLREVAKLVRSSIRQSDFLARYGGEELIVILNGSNAVNARNVADKIRSCIEKTRFHIQDESICVTVSLGVTEVISSDAEPETPFIRVDEAMYRAKRDGRNRVRVITDLSFCRIPAGDLRTGPLTPGAG